MLTFLFISAVVLLALVIGGLIAIPILAVGSLVWLVLLPIRLLFKGMFWLVGALLGMVLAPILMLVVGVVLVGALAAGIVSLLAPLLPIVLLALFVWAIYRLIAPRSGFSASGFGS